MMMCLECGERPIHSRGRCNRCYLRWRRSGAFEPVSIRGLVCACCGRPAATRGMCRTAYMRWYMARYRQELRDAYR